MTIKEFEIQKALGLAGEYRLTLDTTSTKYITIQNIKDAVEKHTFTSVCVTQNVDWPYSTHYDRLTGAAVTTSAGYSVITLIFEVRCVHTILRHIETELYPHDITMLLTRHNDVINTSKYYN